MMRVHNEETWARVTSFDFVRNGEDAKTALGGWTNPPPSVVAWVEVGYQHAHPLPLTVT